MHHANLASQIEINKYQKDGNLIPQDSMSGLKTVGS
jgi:hypothetical protein